MVGLWLSEDLFEYDIYSLVKAFYPQEEVVRRDMAKPQEDLLSIRVTYREDQIEAEVGGRKESVQVAGYPRPERKSALKRMLYEMLAGQTGRKLPWGTLTGIRPVKIPFALMEEGRSEQEIVDEMKEKYLAEEGKIRLSMEIAERERMILKKLGIGAGQEDTGYSLYIGIPFCPTRCLYCSFPSYPLRDFISSGKKIGVQDYVEALCKEIAFIAKWTDRRKPSTIYVGGGTPTALEPEQLEQILQAVREGYGALDGVFEFTVEAGRPDSVTREKLAVLRKFGVTRISINPQTMKQETLELIGRHHTVEQTREAFALARECGFDNINMDLIVGLPGEAYADMERTMREVCVLRPENITVHSLAVKRASRLNERKEEYVGYGSTNNDQVSEMIERYARSIGLAPYYLYRQKNMTGNQENVGYAAPGLEGLYNILIMEEKQTIVAVGAGAVSKFVTNGRIDRVDNVKSLEQYVGRIDEMIERKRKHGIN
jgi:oxygen-independent coproporphyrinogen-3 oxidase